MMYFLVFDSYIHICTNMLIYTRKEEAHRPTTGTDRKKGSKKMIINFSKGRLDQVLYEVATFTASANPDTIPEEYINRNYNNLVYFGQMALKENYKTDELQEVSKNFFQKFRSRFPY